ncbi:unnamed protein product [Danaus chrysippus]|uniref:(African queen) hypothetical protein n=1 Tax=Danaus chrysippus TaxID=151541 RepID=A0A8J2VWI4_9NEOP|nr:unnamed protein product [Danaus chrysippus]
MDMSLSEICAMLGDRIEQYNSASRKRRTNITYSSRKKLLSSKMELSSYLSSSKSKETSVEPPINAIMKSPVSSVSFSSTTKISEVIQNRRYVRRSVIIQPKKLTFDIEED